MRYLTLSCVPTIPPGVCGDLEKVVEIADQAGFRLAEVVEMPANNFGVVLLSDTHT